MAAASAVSVDACSEDRSVKAFGSDGQLRRKRFSQKHARELAELKAVIPQWDRRGQKILCIHFYGESRIPVKNRLKAGTIYVYQEQIDSRRAWTHKRLPYRAVDAATGFVEPPEILDRYIRRIFLEVPLSIMCQVDVTPKRKLAEVISIDTGRQKLIEKRSSARQAELVAFPARKAA